MFPYKPSIFGYSTSIYGNPHMLKPTTPTSDDLNWPWSGLKASWSSWGTARSGLCRDVGAWKQQRSGWWSYAQAIETAIVTTKKVKKLKTCKIGWRKIIYTISETHFYPFGGCYNMIQRNYDCAKWSPYWNVGWSMLPLWKLIRYLPCLRNSNLSLSLLTSRWIAHWSTSNHNY